jgi:hypothetical protein
LAVKDFIVSVSDIVKDSWYLQLWYVAATTITFSFVGPADNGGLPTRKYAVQYKEERQDWKDALNKTWPVGMHTPLFKIQLYICWVSCVVRTNLLNFLLVFALLSLFSRERLVESCPCVCLH